MSAQEVEAFLESNGLTAEADEIIYLKPTDPGMSTDHEPFDDTDNQISLFLLIYPQSIRPHRFDHY
jgi:hypothetical protein